jgi:PE family
MSFVMAAPQFMDAASTDLAAIGSALGAAHVAAATPTRALLPAAADEVSAGIAQLFSQHADDYQKLAGQAASFHGQFIQQLTATANAYISAEAASVALLRPAAASAGSAANAAATGIRWYDQLNIAINNYIDSVIQAIGFLFFLPFYLPIALSFLPFWLILSAFFPEAFPIDGFFPFVFSIIFG